MPISTELNVRIKNKISTTAEWASNDIVLFVGEIGIERTVDKGDKIKIGDGVTPFSQLPYQSAEVEALINQLFTDVDNVESNVSNLSGTVSSLNGTVGTLNTNVTSLTSTVNTLNGTVGSLSTTVGTLNSNYSSLEARVAALEAGGSGGTEIVVSATQPSGQSSGSFWYKEL